MVLSRKSEGTALLQVEHYKVENERLLKILAETDQFKNFRDLVPENIDAVRTLDKQRPATAKVTKQQKNLKEFSVGEFEDWVPQEAFKVAHDFRNRCASQVSASLMNQLLNDLNKIWREREQKQIAKIRSDCNRELQFLRRQIQFKKPYDKVMSEKQVQRLKGDLKSAKATLRENVAVIK